MRARGLGRHNPGCRRQPNDLGNVIRQFVIAGVLAALVAGCAGQRYGTTHTLYVQQIGARARWISACQPTRDTDGDGEIRVASGQHGEVFGDAMTPFVFLERGPPLEVEAVYDATPDERFIAVAIGGRLALVDATTGTRTDVAEAPS